MRKIPATIVTQHPDHASKPYWQKSAYISTHQESEEAYRSFADLGATEYKWDWEGKLVDESVVERLFGDYFDYFSKYPLGQERFLTFRLPNPRVQSEFRLLRAFVNMASAASVAKHFGFKVPPIFEVILPLTETAEEMLDLQEAYEQIHFLKHPLYKLDGFLTNLRVIPLFETVSTIIRSDKILKKYLFLYKRRFNKQPPYMRPYVARSDPALNSGIIPTVLAIKIALSHYKDLSEKLDIPLYPIIGAASLPFRGGLNPERVKEFVQEYKGVRTTTIQSAFRYDYPVKKVQSAISYLERNLPLQECVKISLSEEKLLIPYIQRSQQYYKGIIEQVAPTINSVASYIPRRRERFLHIGLFGYSRGSGTIKLPRAISFTCALYSLGIPPEFIGTGKAIQLAQKKHMLTIVEKYYQNIKPDLQEAGRFLNKGNLKQLAKTFPAWKKIEENVSLIETYLGMQLGPISKSDKKHKIITSKILEKYNKNESLSRYIEQAAILRKSLG